MTKNYDLLKLSNQLCFLVYRIDREINAHYRPFLKELNLTYPQYLVMLVLWEEDGLPIGAICSKLKLDTGTISPLLRRLEMLGMIFRIRSKVDERSYSIHLTDEGKALRERAVEIPENMLSCMNMDFDNYTEVKATLEMLLEQIRRQTDGAGAK